MIYFDKDNIFLKMNVVCYFFFYLLQKRLIVVIINIIFREFYSVFVYEDNIDSFEDGQWLFR